MKLDLHQAATKNKKNEHGLVSIITVTLIVIILALMTAGFAKIMDRELRQSLDRELATQANYAAEAGLNDARNYIANAANSDTAGGCLDTKNLTAQTLPYFAPNGSISNGLGDLVKYTCINIDTNPNELSYDIPAGTILGPAAARGRSQYPTQLARTPRKTFGTPAAATSRQLACLGLLFILCPVTAGQPTLP
jgi:hypothetical protein